MLSELEKKIIINIIFNLSIKNSKNYQQLPVHKKASELFIKKDQEFRTSFTRAATGKAFLERSQRSHISRSIPIPNGVFHVINNTKLFTVGWVGQF